VKISPKSRKSAETVVQVADFGAQRLPLGVAALAVDVEEVESVLQLRHLRLLLRQLSLEAALAALIKFQLPQQRLQLHPKIMNMLRLQTYSHPKYPNKEQMQKFNTNNFVLTTFYYGK